jgi:hypothetical protein
MATFYLLPPRASLESALSELLGRVLPGLPVPAETWEAVVERLGELAGWPSDVFLVPRDDLSGDAGAAEELAAAFGAEPGDRVVEISLARGPAAARTWVLPPVGVSSLPPAH